MKIAVVGEGPSDIGSKDITGTFKKGPMYILIEKIIRSKTNDQIDVVFYTRSELKQIRQSTQSKKLMTLKKKDQKKGIGDFTMSAKILGAEAIKNKCDIAIFFHDTDGSNRTPASNWDKIRVTVYEGFDASEFNKGVAMLPKPIGEAWFLCAQNSYNNCQKIESYSGHQDSKNCPKKLLDIANLGYQTLNDFVNDLDIDKLNMPSYNHFKERLYSLL